MLSREEYKEYCRRYRVVWNYLKSCSKNQDEVAREICVLREYEYERMGVILKKADFIYPENVDVKNLERAGEDLALLSKEGNFLLTGRYIFPVMDMLGNIIALIGWYPDEKKYVTTPSKMFSKECLFFGMEQLGTTGIGKTYFITEGIFDCLTIRSMGFPCIAQMGINSSRYKEVLYTMFKQLIAIPDNDTQGTDVLKNDKWKIPHNGKYFRWKCNTYIKDIDKLCNMFEYDDVKYMLQCVIEEPKRIVELNL